MKKHLSFLLTLMVTAGVSYAQTVEVTPENMEGWSLGSFNADTDVFPGDPSDTAQFVSGPGTPPLGTGSVELATGAGEGQDGVFATTSVLDGVKLSNLTVLSYSTYVTSNNGQQLPFLKLSISLQGNGVVNDSLFFEPPYQQGATDGNPGMTTQETPELNTWQSWNVLAGGFYDGNGTFGSPGEYESASDSGVQSLAAFLALYPNATIETDATSGYDSLRLTMGEVSSSDLSTSYIDDVALGYKNANGGTTDIAYDFEEAPEPSTYGLLLGGLASLGLFRWRKLSLKYLPVARG
jgi:hypothetical protein